MGFFHGIITVNLKDIYEILGYTATLKRSILISQLFNRIYCCENLHNPIPFKRKASFLKNWIMFV